VIQRTFGEWTLICRSLLYPIVKLSLAEKRSYHDDITAVNFGDALRRVDRGKWKSRYMHVPVSINHERRCRRTSVHLAGI